MPIYEFKCKDCNSEFELLLFSGEEAVCPQCKSKNLQKKVSKVSFTVSGNDSGSSSSGGSACSSCTSTNCSSCKI